MLKGSSSLPMNPHMRWRNIGSRGAL